MEKALERNEAFFGIFFMKIMENRSKGKWKYTGCMWGWNWRKIMEYQYTSFVSSIFGIHILFSLSYSWTLKVFLEHSWRSLAHLGFGVRRKRKSRKEQGDNGINGYSGFCLQISSYMYDFLASFGMHCTCMWFLGYDLSLAWKIA